MTTDIRNRLGPLGIKAACDVLVDGQVFSIDRDLFLRRSAFLRRAVEESNNQDTNTSTPVPIEFEDIQVCDARTFSMYKRFVEEGDVDVVDPEDLLTFLIQIHTFAWHLQDYTAANSSIDMIIDAIPDEETAPSLEHIKQVYEPVSLLAYGCPLKRVMVDFQIHDPRSMPCLDYEDDEPETFFNFLLDVVVGYQVLTGTKGDRGEFGEANDIFGNKPENRDICDQYHKHDEDHKRTECPGARLGRESELSRRESEVSGQEMEESGQEGEDSSQESEEPRP